MIDAKYTKPSDGIPADDIASGVIPVEKGAGVNSVQQKGTGAIASGTSAFAEGGDNLQGNEPGEGEELLYSKADGYASHAEGAALATGRYSHAEGGGNRIEEGYPTRSTAEGQYSHAEGSHTYAKGGMTHAEGNLTIAEGYGSHAEGSKTLTTGNAAHAEGINTVAGVGDRPSISTNTESGNYSHAEGNGTQASGNSSHAEGKHTLAEGPYSHAEGINTRASGQNSHAEGHSQTNVLDTTVSKSNDGIIEDWNSNKFTLAKGAASHAEGKDNLALGARSHAEGYQTIANGANSHSENYNTKASGANSHAEGASCEAKGERSHVEGFHTETNNASEHAEGSYNKSNTDTRHSVGIGSSESDRKNAFEIMKNGDAYLYGIGKYDGTNIEIEEARPHANTVQDVIKSLENDSVWEKGSGVDSIQQKGTSAEAYGASSHAEGECTVTRGNYSHVEGYYTGANNESEHAEGRYNKSNKASDDYGDAGNTQHSVGIGTDEVNLKNAFEIMQNGDAYLYGVGGYNGTNPTIARRIQDALMQCTGVKNIISLTKAEYDALANKDSETIYLVAYSHDYVDLGLRDGNNNKILFATCNIGASSPEEYGDYFAWGETSKRYTSISGDSVVGGSFTWDNCPYCTNSEGSKFSKYTDVYDEAAESGTADGKTVLEPVDDVATVLWGGNWRMPSQSDLEYLISDNVTRTWIDNYNETGISGILISGKDSFSESSIFFPSAGAVDGTTVLYAGVGGIYPCREIYGIIYINTLMLSSEEEAQVAPALVRYYGQSVRPVHVGDVVPSYKLYKGSSPINDTYSKSEIDEKIGDIESILVTL